MCAARAAINPSIGLKAELHAQWYTSRVRGHVIGYISKANLSGDMALRLEKAFGVKMDTLMRMQSAYDIAQTRKREKLIRVRRVQPRADARLEPG